MLLISRWPVIAALVLVAGGTALVVGGSYTATASAYVWGLALAALGAGLGVFLVLQLRTLARVAICGVVAVVVIGLGVWLPYRALNSEFAGENVQWAVASDDEFIEGVLDEAAVLANRSSARFISLADGRELNRIQADRDDTFSRAGDRLLVIRDRSAMLYDRVGKPVWPKHIRADRGVASAPGFTLLETKDVVSAVADDGGVRWTRPVDEVRAATGRFPNVTMLPDDTGEPPVLPSIGALPLRGTQDEWEFVDPASAETVHRERGAFAGVVGKTMVTSTQTGDRCAVRTSVGQRSLACSYGSPWAMGQALFFRDGVDASVIELPGDPEARRLEDVAIYTTGAKARRLKVSSEGMAWRDGQLVRGYPKLNYSRPWTFVAESASTSVDVARHAVVVNTALPRTNPFDPRPGHAPGVELPDQDYRITVLDQQTGRVTGSIRVDSVDSIEPVARGVALVAADGKVMLLGRP
ncbi:hypothetical protein NLX83_40625 [Allokutzneria sp. A3M-2-11 16]|uniref:hypothetical protein n=1 Tax=Allokutzneria sp. A3M-2-11 16 TaxID=2962043 RepID=UPI0020B89A47|nr:hypothetical protein [Allokutzneria sp. A3M-2-11 16]MCP3805588.1 hypothetical protein [Allokutzneria sp. A3M-2-11 16]